MLYSFNKFIILGDRMELLTIVHDRKIEYIPIIHEFAGKITQHILFFDHSKKECAYAAELKRSIERFNAKYNFNTEIKMMQIDEDSKQDMQEIAKVFEGNSENIYLNGAGADTALFTVLSSIILKNNGKVIAYDKEDNSYNLISKHGFVNKEIKSNMNLDDFLILMGDRLIKESSKEAIYKNKESLETLFSDTKRMFKVRYLLKNRKTKELKKQYPQMIKALEALGIVNGNGILKGQEGFVRFGFLFEEFIYLQLKDFAFDDIKVGAIIEFDKEQVKQCNIEITNEFDVLIIHNNKVGFIECKIGESFETIGVVYKSDSVMEYFGENSSSLIVNIERDKTPHFKNSKRNFGESVLLRAKTKNVSVYNAFDFSKPAFRSKVSQAFEVEMTKGFQKEQIKALESAWR